MHNARAHVDLVHPGRGWRGGKLALAHFPATSSPRSQALPNSQGGFHNAVRKSTSWERKLTNLPPMENFGHPTILLPGHLDYHLSGAYIGISIHLRCLWDFGKRQIRPHTRTPEQSSRRTAQTFQSQLPWKQPFAVRCSTLFQGVGKLTATRGRGETKIVSQISSPDICLLENI